MEILSKETIELKLKSLTGWVYKENAIELSHSFSDFKEAFGAMTRIAFEAEAQSHHPEWFNVYNRLTIRLSTHDAGGVTAYDFKLAEAINTIIN